MPSMIRLVFFLNINLLSFCISLESKIEIKIVGITNSNTSEYNLF